MKNPNGYGTVVKLSGNRRKPFAVSKTVGLNEKGPPIYLPIGYAETREEGMEMLAMYNHEPWNIDRDKVTLKMLSKVKNENVTAQSLVDEGIIGKVNDGRVIRGTGKLDKKVNVSAVRFTKSAKEQIEALGGKAEVI